MLPPDVLNLSHLWRRYKRWVIANPQVIGDVETTVKWASYFVAGRISNSNVATELIYSLSNLLCLLNDRILMADLLAKQQSLDPPNKDTLRIKMFMTTLEYCEVFLELSGQQLWGRRGRWFIIVILQVIKCIGRFILVLRQKEKIVRSPPIPCLDRHNLNAVALALQQQQQQSSSTVENGFQSEEATFKLRRTGKVMRRVDGAPSVQHRDWKPLAASRGTDRDALLLDAAEYLYICKPLVHLGSVAAFGYHDWRSWGAAFAMDMASIRLYYNNRQLLSREQKLELSKRCLMMFMYLMRSPFYDRVTSSRIEGTLGLLSRNIPFARHICGPLAKYIPVWQETYFYMWSS